MALAHGDVTSGIIGAAIEVHRTLGPGYLESIYENALAIEFRRRTIPFQRQVAVPVLDREVEVGLHRLDFYVADLIVVELKAVKDLEDVHFAVVRSYLRAVGRDHGLILNLAKAVLEVKRVITRSQPLPGFLGSSEVKFPSTEYTRVG
ncbi:MAG: GxxExxY protein [Vicinamibacteria bacterium]